MSRFRPCAQHASPGASVGAMTIKRVSETYCYFFEKAAGYIAAHVLISI
jgi:hypothetical protein